MYTVNTFTQGSQNVVDAYQDF